MVGLQNLYDFQQCDITAEFHLLAASVMKSQNAALDPPQIMFYGWIMDGKIE